MSRSNRRSAIGRTRDGRSLSHADSAAIRHAAVERVQDGELPGAVMRAYGLCRTTIYRWLALARRGGVEALAPKPHPGRTPRVDARAAQDLSRWLAGSAPREYGIVGPALWTKSSVSALLASRMGVDAHGTAVTRALERIGLRATGGRLGRVLHRVALRRRRMDPAFRRAPVFMLDLQWLDLQWLDLQWTDGSTMVSVSNPRLGLFCDVMAGQPKIEALVGFLREFGLRAHRSVVVAHRLAELQGDRSLVATLRGLGIEPVFAR